MRARKGIILAGGRGTRLYPLTFSLSKHLLPVYDKPMIYYPLATLMLAKIRDILIISTPDDLPNYQRLLGDGHQFGLRLSYMEQPVPNGLAQAFVLGESFIQGHPTCLILGDNVFYGPNFSINLEQANSYCSGATIFGYHVSNPTQFGVVELDDQKKPVHIEEKPLVPKSNYAVTGLYFYDENVVDIAKSIKPSKRGEYEITDINNIYLQSKQLQIELLGNSFYWMDTGTHDSLLEASQCIRTLEQKQGLKIACLEEIALKFGWISNEACYQRAIFLKHSNYGQYLMGKLQKCCV